MTFTGEFRTICDAIDCSVPDPAILQAIALAGLPETRSEFDLGPQKLTYLTAEGESAEFAFENGRLHSVFLHTVPDDDHGAYARPDALVDGLSGNAARDEVRAMFGEPEWSNATADRFQVEERLFIRFGYVDDRTVKLTAMAHVQPL